MPKLPIDAEIQFDQSKLLPQFKLFACVNTSVLFVSFHFISFSYNFSSIHFNDLTCTNIMQLQAKQKCVNWRKIVCLFVFIERKRCAHFDGFGVRVCAALVSRLKSNTCKRNKTTMPTGHPVSECWLGVFFIPVSHAWNFNFIECNAMRIDWIIMWCCALLWGLPTPPLVPPLVHKHIFWPLLSLARLLCFTNTVIVLLEFYS